MPKGVRYKYETVTAELTESDWQRLATARLPPMYQTLIAFLFRVNNRPFDIAEIDMALRQQGIIERFPATMDQRHLLYRLRKPDRERPYLYQLVRVKRLEPTLVPP